MYCSWLLFKVGLTSYSHAASELAQFAHVGFTPSHFCFLVLQRRQATAVRTRFRTFGLAGLGEVADRSSMVEMRVAPSLPGISGYYMSLPSGVHLGRRRRACGDCGQRMIRSITGMAILGRATTIPMKPLRHLLNKAATSTDRIPHPVLERR